MKAHCLFEQSGTFKNEFKKLGVEAFDYDIKNEFGETDFTVDLFREIENAYEGGCRYLTTFLQTMSSWRSSLARCFKRTTECGSVAMRTSCGITQTNGNLNCALHGMTSSMSITNLFA